MPYFLIQSRTLILFFLMSMLIGCSTTTTETAVTQPPVAIATTKVEPTTEPEPTVTEIVATKTAVPEVTPEPEIVAPEAASPYLPAENVFTLVSSTPIIEHGPQDAWDSTNISAGPIVFHDGQYHMLQNALTGWPPQAGGTAYSTSEDGYSWNRVGAESIFSASDIDGEQVPFASAAYVQPDGAWVMYFNTWPLNRTSHQPRIYRATAPEASGPWTVDADPVLEPGGSGSWDSNGVEAPSVLQTDDGFVMYYAGNDLARNMIGLATSTDGIIWEKYNDPTTDDAKFADSDPVFLPNEDKTAWDSGSIMNADVIQTSDGWVMAYNSRGSVGQATGYALSEDGLNWQRSEAPIINPEEISGGRGSYGPAIRFMDDTYHLFVEIVVNGKSSVYLATHEGALLLEPTAAELPLIENAAEEPETAVSIERFDAANILPLYSTDPVIAHGEEGDWDRNLDITAVLYHDGQFHAFLNRFPGWPPTTFGLSYHTSPDGLNWTQMADEPVFSEEDLPDQNHVPIGGSMHVEEDGTWVHYFFTWNKRSRSSTHYIGRATAPDPLGPWTADEEYVLEPGASGAWDSRGVTRPFVIQNEDGYVIYYVGQNGRSRIGMATSPDGINWTKYNDPETTDNLYADSDPVFLPSDESGTWDQYSVSDPNIWQTPDGWVMLYASSVSNGVQVGYALSDDGIHWQRSQAPLQAFEEIPNKTALWSTELVYHDGIYYLFGEVKTGQFSGIYAATQEGSLIP